MIKFSRSTKKKKAAHAAAAASGHPPARSRNGDRSVSSAYSAASTRSGNDGIYGGAAAAPPPSGGGGGGLAGLGRRGGRRGGATGSSQGGRHRGTAESVGSINSASVFAPTVCSGVPDAQQALQPSSARLLREFNASGRSSLLSSLGTAASRTFRAYKMSLPRCPPPVRLFTGSAAAGLDAAGDAAGEAAALAAPVETDLELLGRTVHAVSSALTEPPREGERYLVYDVSFNPKGCVWDALIGVSLGDAGDAPRRGDDADAGRDTLTFPIRVTCAEDDEGPPDAAAVPRDRRGRGAPHLPAAPRAKTYAVDLAVTDDFGERHIRGWTRQSAAEHRDDVKDAMEWVSYGVRRSMARSMFPTFPEGCQGRAFREVYQLNKKLKSGTFSTVCRGVHRATGRHVAVKCILRKKIEPSVDAAVFEEVLIMSGLHHRWICPMIDYFEEDRCHFVVMELEKGGDLCERLNEKGTYSEADARQVARNICEAMEFVHSKGFAHCDIKPRNYLLRSKRDDVDVRLADFGFAQHVHAPNSLTSQCGTPFFVAPEVINRKPYDTKVDMWSIGITCYLLLCGDTPFNGKNRQQLFRRISCDEPSFSDDKWGHISDEGVDFVRQLLQKDPAKRLSSIDALSHRWLADLGDQNNHHSMGSAVSVASAQPTLDSSGEIEAKQRSPKSPAKVSAANRRAIDAPPSPGERPRSARSTNHHRSKSREHSRSREHVKDRATSREPLKNRTKSRERAKRRSVSRDRSYVSRGAAPPPPPKPQARSRSRESSAAKNRMGESTAEIENARLLEHIKNQDAKIDKLERMLKRMLEPDVHEC